MKEPQVTDNDVVVIGVGAAGLAAACRLASQTFRVVAIEARERVGGRIWTEERKGWARPIELGAEFIHSGNEELARALRAAGLKKRKVEEQHWLVDKGGRKEMPEAWDRIGKVMTAIGPRFRGSFEQWLHRSGRKVSPEDRALACAFVKGFQGAPAGRMSARTLYEAAQEEDEQFRPSGRYDALIASLETRFAKAGGVVELNCPVETVTWSRRGVTVRAGNRTWKARCALVTVPLGVLKAKPEERGGIVFQPALKKKQSVLARIESGHARRIVVRLRNDIWKRGPIPAELRRRNGQAFGFLHSEEKYFPVWWADAPRPVLVGWTGGPAAEAMAGWTDARVGRVACASLAKLLERTQGQIARVVREWRTHDWTADPFTRGAYSFSVAGEEKAPAELARAVGGRLFFAGEATADKLELGTVHGALASGDRAAREIAKILGSAGKGDRRL